jgi:hypothetical protein
MEAIEKMIFAEQVAAIMDAAFTRRPTMEEAEEILRVALDQYKLRRHERIEPDTNLVRIK